MRSRFTIVSERSLPSQKDQRSYFAKRPLKVIDDPFVTSSSSFVFLKKTSNGKREREKKIADEEVEERMEEKRERTDVIDHETRGKEESSETQEKSG